MQLLSITDYSASLKVSAVRRWKFPPGVSVYGLILSSYGSIYYFQLLGDQLSADARNAGQFPIPPLDSSSSERA